MKQQFHPPNRFRLRTLCLRTAALVSLLAMPCAVITPAFAQAPAAADPAANQEGMEVLTRGPVHEAFAETIVFKPVAGIIAPKAAPALVEELPPDQRPEGDNVQWVPGYWMWEDDTNEFLWVSGIWRNIPPGREWIPGYWQENGSEFQWVSGYWNNTAVEEVEYLPEPPASLEAGPNVDRPGKDYVWMPGNWRWQDDRYLWSAGYWDMGRPDWMWTPSYYSWTPRGYIYVDGYWDYGIGRRGVVFAPVRFGPAYYARPYYYSPATVISLALFGDHLFLRPRTRHYYFGDYYAPVYRTQGFYSWHNYYSGRHGYDPIYAYESWRHRDDGRWQRRVADNFAFYRDNQDQRPPHTWNDFRTFAAQPDKKRRFDSNWVTPLATAATLKDNPVRFRAVNADEKQRFAANGKEMRNFSDRWKKTGPPPGEMPKVSKEGVRTETPPQRVKIPRSPIAAKVSDQPADTPPPVPARASVKENHRDRPLDPSNPKGRPGNRVDPNSNPVPNPDGPPQPKGKPNSLPGERPEVTPGEKPDVTPNPNTDPKRNPKNGRPGRNPSVEPAPTPKVEPRPGPSPTPKVEPQPTPSTPKVEPREPRVNPKGRKVEPSPAPTPKVEPAEQPRSTPRVEPKSNPRTERKVTPRTEPKVVPQDPPSVPKSVPRVEPRPQPKSVPRVEPRPQPKSVPRVEPRPQPKAVPREQPRPQPRVAPAPQPQPQPRPQPAPSPAPSKPSGDERGKDKKGGR